MIYFTLKPTWHLAEMDLVLCMYVCHMLGYTYRKYRYAYYFKILLGIYIFTLVIGFLLPGFYR
ncbi:hypothetical protein F4820DRAFT_401915 [Hypoxylon rubiginosum]|uniref:Uncharacterized protein n=1 Tax=Hypoxylon rubiginosum TaxID=110542 RepID=A0ACB9ZGY0_9PEZI|nr:hypothetical protein F4820DRAFT_401915 [Hypoxylon rubiginosum]